jgi:putative iron-dependent peroxidase
MNTPQKGIFKEGTTAFTYLEYKLGFSGNVKEFSSALKKINDLNSASVSIIICFGKRAWDQINPEWAPENFSDFKDVNGQTGYSMPSTQRDLFFWVNGKQKDVNFDIARSIHNEMKTIATLELEQDGFTYHDARDFTGFIDGTENPKEDERLGIALVPEGKPGAGGSHVFTQKWVHNLEAFHALPEKMQEKIIGRTKQDSVELEGDAMPQDSHVSRADAKVDGVAMKIYRRSAPFGNVSEHGLYFLAFACDPYRIQIQLERMTGATEDKVHDKLMEFSKPISGSYWFAPSMEDLQKILK